MEKIVIVEKCTRCERLLSQRRKASSAWLKRHPEFEKSKARRQYHREWMQAYRKKLKASRALSNTAKSLTIQSDIPWPSP